MLFQDGVATDRKYVAVAAMIGYGITLLRYYKASATKENGEMAKASDYLVAYATETGTARQFAKQTCKTIRQEGLRASLVELNHLASAQVPTKALLVIASTTGNGDAPRTGTRGRKIGAFSRTLPPARMRCLRWGTAATRAFVVLAWKSPQT